MIKFIENKLVAGKLPLTL